MKSYSHWGMFPFWEVPSLDEQARSLLGGVTVGLPPMVEQPSNLRWVYVPIGAPCLPALPDGQSYTPYPILTPHEDDLKLTIVKT